MATLEGYRFGQVLVDGRDERRDLIVLPGRVVRNWWRKDGHALVMDDLDEVLGDLPGKLIVGTGASGFMRPDPETLDLLRSRGIDVEIYRTDQAIRRYAELDPAETAAALHLTC